MHAQTSNDVKWILAFSLTNLGLPQFLTYFDIKILYGDPGESWVTNLNFQSILLHSFTLEKGMNLPTSYV